MILKVCCMESRLSRVWEIVFRCWICRRSPEILQQVGSQPQSITHKKGVHTDVSTARDCKHWFFSMSSVDCKKGRRKGATSKIAKKCQKVSRHFSTIFAQGKKRQKSLQSVKKIFDTFRQFSHGTTFPAPFGGLWCLPTIQSETWLVHTKVCEPHLNPPIRMSFLPLAHVSKRKTRKVNTNRVSHMWFAKDRVNQPCFRLECRERRWFFA